MNQNNTQRGNQIKDENMTHIANQNETAILGNGIWWYTGGLRQSFPTVLTLETQAKELDRYGMDLDAMVIASRRAQRPRNTMRDRLETISERWGGVVQHRAGRHPGRIITPQVIIERSGSGAAALVTSNENCAPTSHINVVIPYQNLRAPIELPEIARQSLKSNQISALFSRAAEAHRGGASVGFTIATGPRDRGFSYPEATFSLDTLLVRELLAWMWRLQQQADRADLAKTVEQGWTPTYCGVGDC
jgi:hypothetical protein